MEIEISQSTLLEALELVGKISTKHVSLPVLQCVLFEAKAQSVILRATNLEIGIEITKPATVAEEGIVAVPATVLLQTIQLISQPTITLRLEEQTLYVVTKSSETQINTIPHDEFPTFNKIDGTTITINHSLFSLGIRSVAFAASQSSIKPELGSINILQKKEHSLTFVATDSFRLMEKTTPQKGVTLEHNILLPQKNALECARLCDVLGEDPQLITTENQIALSFAQAGVYVTARVVNGSFPDYEQIIPKEYSTFVTVLKNDLATLFKKTNIFLNRFAQVTLTISTAGITASANNGEVGTTTESITAQMEGEEIALNFNQRYLLEPLQHITDDSLKLSFAGIGRPLVYTGVSDASFRYLVMPMNK